MKLTLSLRGTVVDTPEPLADKLPFALKSRQKIRRGATRDATATVQKLQAAPDDAVCVRLAGGFEWWLRADDAVREFGVGKRRGGRAQGIIELDPAAALSAAVARSAGAARGSRRDGADITNIALDSMELVGIDLAGKTAHAIGEWAENKVLDAQGPGLYRVNIGASEMTLEAVDAVGDKSAGPVLIFIHGTGSSSRGSFAELWEPKNSAGAAARKQLADHYGERVYEELCAALLDHSPTDGVALFHALMARPTINITDSLTGLPFLLLDVFKAKESPEADELCRKTLEDCNTDLALFQVTLVCRFGTRQAWLNRLIGDWLGSGRGYYCQARALTLLGFGKDADEGKLLDEWNSTHGDCWLRDVAKESLKRQRRNVWAMRWFDRYLVTADRPLAWAYFRLFVRCIDRRVWLWLDKVGLENAPEWKRDAVSANHGVIVAAIKENEKGWGDYFLGQKVMKRELWPWMENYFQ